jgi:hypothetical protein
MAKIYHMVLDDYPDHAIALGRMLGHWGELETCLMRMTEFLLGADYDQKAYYVYKEFYNIRSKINLLIRLNKWFTRNKTVQNDIDKLLSKAYSLNETRNSFIHARWTSKAGYGDTSNKLMRISLGSGNLHQPNVRSKYFTPKDIQGFGEEIAKLSQSFEDLLDRVLPTP